MKTKKKIVKTKKTKAPIKMKRTDKNQGRIIAGAPRVR